MAESDPFIQTPLSTEDDVLLATYKRIGVKLGKLPYSKDMDRIVELAVIPLPVTGITDDVRWNVWQRLLSLRRRAYISDPS